MTYYPRRILVAFDFSQSSLEAIRHALTIAAADDKIVVINIIDDNYPTYASIEYPEIIDRKVQTLRCRKMRHCIADEGIDTKRLVMRSEFGDPGTEVARIAGESNADLIVIPSHGRRGISRVLLGSVAERVARLAPCSILIMRQSADQQ